jgi:hypothetical protein
MIATRLMEPPEPMDKPRENGCLTQGKEYTNFQGHRRRYGRPSPHSQEGIMRKKTSSSLVAAAFAIALALCAGPAMAAGGISGSLGIVPMGAGDAGEGFLNPQYNDAFKTGGIVRVEPFYDFTPMIRGQVGIAHAKWDGDTFNGVHFEDLKMNAFYAGVRVRFLEGRPFRPYAVADLGFARLDSVSVTGLHAPGQTSRYWDSTDTAYFDIGGGCEFVVNPRLSFFVDLRVMATGQPDSADPPFSDADGVGSMPLTAGVNFSF